MRDRIERFRADWEALGAFYDVPLSVSGLQRRQSFLAEELAGLEGLDFEALDRDDRVDWLAFRNWLGRERMQLDRRIRWAREELEALGFAEALVRLEEGRRALEPVDPSRACEVLAEATKRADELRARVAQALRPGDAAEEAPLSAELALRAGKATEALRGAMSGWVKHYADYKPEFGWWLGQPGEALDKALTRVARLLERLAKREPDALVGTPIGAEDLEADLAHELLAYDSAGLLAIGEREVAWCERELRRASAELGYGDDWRAALEHVKGLHAPVGAQDEAIAEQVREAIAWVEARDLVSLDPLAKELWRLDMLSSESQRTLPYQAYGGLKVLVSFPTRDMDLERRTMSMRANNLHFSRAVTQHEMIPGHHLQIWSGRRFRPWRRLMTTPFLLEGWCLYWELLLWDLGFARGPEDRLGMLFWRMHRCARIVVSLRFHRGEMTPAEMVDYLVAHVGHERDAAASEVRRYIGGDYSPVYQCAYMIGGLQLRQLSRELVDSGRMSMRQFHDAVLAENAIPVELIRASLAGHELTRDFRPEWRFAE